MRKYNHSKIIIKHASTKGFFKEGGLYKRVVHDFLEKMPKSMNELGRGKKFIPKNPRLLVNEGFYDKEN